ncbi:hypothetical protein HanRHA438_Chr11g0491951 [Helianthus annuus]|nr:hypothetical protein HanRHA438_Chr11g0491951 [Helianthus annuus]
MPPVLVCFQDNRVCQRPRSIHLELDLDYSSMVLDTIPFPLHNLSLTSFQVEEYRSGNQNSARKPSPVDQPQLDFRCPKALQLRSLMSLC